MNCPSPVAIKDPRFVNAKPNAQLLVPCKGCIACRINKTSEWQMRILMELQSWKDARFITLDYKPGLTPPNKSLEPYVLSDFFKALRQNLNGRPIKYFACGEYGNRKPIKGAVEGSPEWEQGERPHYHAIVFGLTSSLEDRKAVFDAWKREDEWKWFGKTWQDVCGTVTPDSAAYVAGYCQKKLTGKLGEQEYKATNRLPPFQHQSKAIGEQYFLEHMEQYVRDGFIYFRGKNHPIPETWKRKFNISLEDRKKDFYELEKEQYLMLHPEITEAFYDWHYHKFGTALADDDLQAYKDRAQAFETIRARNNLKNRRNKL